LMSSCWATAWSTNPKANKKDRTSFFKIMV
jgi:hypothetical protein